MLTDRRMGRAGQQAKLNSATNIFLSENQLHLWAQPLVHDPYSD